jgi:glutaredoxin-like protein NrdH
MTFTLYTKPACVQCNATKLALTKAGLVEGVDYRTVDVSQDAAALEQIKEAGFLQAPVIITDDDAWSGFRPDKIATLTAAA